MLRWQIRILKAFYKVLDLFTLSLGLLAAVYILSIPETEYKIFHSPLELYGVISVGYLCYLAVFLLVELYDSYMRAQKAMTKKLALKTIFAHLAGHILSFLFLVLLLPGYTYIFHLLFSILFLVLSTLVKLIYYSIRNKDYQNYPKKRSVIIVGQSSYGVNYIETMRNHSYLQYNIIGFIHIKNAPAKEEPGYRVAPLIEARLGVDINNKLYVDNSDNLLETSDYEAGMYGDLPHLGSLDNLAQIVNRQAVDELVVVRPMSYDERLIYELEAVQQRGITVTMLLNRAYEKTADAIVTMVGEIPALKFHTVSLHEGKLVTKRILDICGALVGMLFFVAAWLLFAPLIKLDSPGPVIFKQERVGKNGRVFKIWKFRSMFTDAEMMKKLLADQNEIKGHMFKMTHDPRVTRIGRIIRKTYIDELPQFYNVLKGNMSLVGTRPPTLDEVKEYQTHHYKRISVIPGITGLWQVSGGSSIRDFEEVVKLDNEYIRNWSVWQDIKIIGKTVFMMLKIFKSVFNRLKPRQKVFEDPDLKKITELMEV